MSVTDLTLGTLLFQIATLMIVSFATGYLVARIGQYRRATKLMRKLNCPRTLADLVATEPKLWPEEESGHD